MHRLEAIDNKTVRLNNSRQRIRPSDLRLGIWISIVVAWASLPIDGFAQRRTDLTTGSLPPQEIVKRVMPSVVLVETQDRQGKAISQGSGFVYAPGLIVTNLHVFKRASGALIRVVNSSTNHSVVSIVGVDVRRDVCIVRIADKTLPFIPLAKSPNPAVGDEVYAFGSPKGLEGSVSKGIVSSLRPDSNLIQIDASISPGSSGGPVVNGSAQVVGIAVASLVGGQNLNFAVPSRFVNELSVRQFDKDVLTKFKRTLGEAVQDSDFGLPILAAGALSVSDSENEKLKGPVRCYSVYSVLFEYDDIQDKHVEGTRKIVSTRCFDTDGYLVEERQYHDGQFARKYSNVRDNLGFIVKTVWEISDGTREEKSFDRSEAAWRRLEGVDPVGLAGTHEDSRGKSVRDSAGNLIEASDQADNFRWEKSYGKDGLLVEDKHFQNGNLLKIYRYSYQYDRKGNWIKTIATEFDPKLSLAGFQPRYVRYRELTYF